jgi:hypothetical protein
MPARPLGGVSLDLDDLWAYLKAQGNPAWKSYPSFLDRVVPLALVPLAAWSGALLGLPGAAIEPASAAGAL